MLGYPAWSKVALDMGAPFRHKFQGPTDSRAMTSRGTGFLVERVVWSHDSSHDMYVMSARQMDTISFECPSRLEADGIVVDVYRPYANLVQVEVLQPLDVQSSEVGSMVPMGFFRRIRLEVGGGRGPVQIFLLLRRAGLHTSRHDQHARQGPGGHRKNANNGDNDHNYLW